MESVETANLRFDYTSILRGLSVYLSHDVFSITTVLPMKRVGWRCDGVVAGWTREACRGCTLELKIITATDNIYDNWDR